MHTIYEYLFTALIIVAIVVAASTMLTAMSTPLKMVSEQGQLKVMADVLLGQVLLSTGNPADWGANLSVIASDITMFGLAKQTETTRASYVLDVDKVQRLRLPVTGSTLPVAPSDARNLLQLGRDYGFALEIIPILDVTVQNGSEKGADFVLWVRNSEGLPIPGASITANAFYVFDGLRSLVTYGIADTSEVGKYTLEFPKTSWNNTHWPGPQDDNENGWYKKTMILGMIVEYEGTRIIKFFTGSEYGDKGQGGENTGVFSTVGDHLFVAGDYTPYTNVVYDILAYRRSGSSAFGNVSFPLQSPNVTVPSDWTGKRMTYVEPSAVAFMTFNSTHLLVATRGVLITGTKGFSTIPGADRFPLGVQLQRVVTIADQTYVFRLYLWRMSW